MEINAMLIANVARLARLTLTPKEIEKFSPQLSDVIDAFSSFQRIDTDGVEPSFHPIPLKDAAREDIPHKCLSQQDALSLTSHKKDGYFKGPRAV